jgi:hypothetical protein
MANLTMNSDMKGDSCSLFQNLRHSTWRNYPKSSRYGLRVETLALHLVNADERSAVIRHLVDYVSITGGLNSLRSG